MISVDEFVQFFLITRGQRHRDAVFRETECAGASDTLRGSGYEGDTLGERTFQDLRNGMNALERGIIRGELGYRRGAGARSGLPAVWKNAEAARKMGA